MSRKTGGIIPRYDLANYYAIGQVGEGNTIRQPLCWKRMGKHHDVCTRACVYCPFGYHIDEIEKQTGKPTQCRLGETTKSPKFCMPECDKDYNAGSCADNKTTVCPFHYSDCKTPGYLEDQDNGGGPYSVLCDLDCCGPDFSKPCKTCYVKGPSEYDFDICKGDTKTHPKIYPPEKRHLTPVCGNYTILALAWT
jgi:hypothetical protein